MLSPAERHFRITRSCLEVLAEFRNPVAIITKNFLVTRDIDLLKELAAFDAVHVTISITTMNTDLAAKMEPRASRPTHRLRAIEMLAKAGVPVSVNVAPIIPGLNDREIPAVLEAAKSAGAIGCRLHDAEIAARREGRLHGVVEAEFSGKAGSHSRYGAKCAGEKLYVSDFGTRMRGEGKYADQISQMFHVFRERLGFGLRKWELSTEHFRRPGETQMMLGV